MDNTNILAVVGNREIKKSDVETLLNTLNPQTAAQFRSEEGTKNLVRELINQELFYLDAIDKGMDKEEAYLAELEKAKIGILKQYALNKLFCDITITEKEAHNFFNTNKDHFGGDASVKASHILVDTKEEAFEIKCEIADGLTFEEAAQKHSKCPSSAQGGDLGFFSRGMMVPEFEDVSFSMNIGDVSEPVKTQFGYHLIKLVDKKDEAPQSFDAMKDQIVSQLVQEKQQEMYLGQIEQLKKKYAIMMNI